MRVWEAVAIGFGALWFFGHHKRALAVASSTAVTPAPGATPVSTPTVPWNNNMGSAVVGSTIAHLSARPSANTRYVQGLYRSILGRGGSASEVAGWVKILDNHGLTQAGVKQKFLSSPEYLSKHPAPKVAPVTVTPSGKLPIIAPVATSLPVVTSPKPVSVNNPGVMIATPLPSTATVVKPIVAIPPRALPPAVLPRSIFRPRILEPGAGHLGIASDAVGCGGNCFEQLP